MEFAAVALLTFSLYKKKSKIVVAFFSLKATHVR